MDIKLPRWATRMIVYLWTGGAALMGFTFMMMGIGLILIAKESTTWPHVVGRVISSTVRASPGSSSSTGNPSTTYRAAVVYEFVVSGKRYNGDTIAYWYAGGSLADAREWADQYSTDDSIAVYYGPDDPTENVMIPGFKSAMYLFPLVSSVFLILGCVGLRYLPKVVCKT